eukprot:g11450.t1
MMTRWISWVAVLLASQVEHAVSKIVEASEVTNVIVSTTAGWDLSGCGVGGCDPRLTRDGKDNTVPASRWSCEPSLAELLGSYEDCSISFTMDDEFQIDHIMLYLHESDTAQISIAFEIEGTISWFGDFEDISALTTPGLALGEGQKVNIKQETDSVTLTFDLTNGQYINLSEVEIYVDVEDSYSEEVDPPAELYVVNAKTLTNVYATAGSWDLSSDDPDCGVAGCVPTFATDGKDNTVGSRWSCEIPSSYDDEDYWNDVHSCHLDLSMDDYFTVSYIVVYVPNSNDATMEGLSFVADVVPFETTKTALGTGQRVNFPRPSLIDIKLSPTNVVAGQVIEISEVEIFVEVTNKNGPISAAVAFIDATADDLSATVVVTASGSVNGTTPAATRDGDDNTVATSQWSCRADASSSIFSEGCELYFDFSDEYTVSYLELYMHESETTSEAVPISICSCTFAVEADCCYYGEVVGTYLTKPGTPLGEPERINLLYPLTSHLAISVSNLTAAGGSVGISEVEIYFRVPDSSPTPAPFLSPAPTPSPTYDLDFFDDDFVYKFIDETFDDDVIDEIIDEYYEKDTAGTTFSKGCLLWAAVAAGMAFISSSLY